MCSIFGMGFMKGHSLKNKDRERVRKFINSLFFNCSDRGRNASGMAFVGAESIKVIKKDMTAADFIKTPEYGRCFAENVRLEGNYYERTMSLIGHCRLQTKGTYRNNVNNHPIVRDTVVGVHNGCISNDDALFSVYQHNFKRNGEVDSEIIFALVEYYTKELGSIFKAIKRACTEVSGSLACAAVHVAQPHLIWLFKLWGPCHVVNYTDTGLIVWASDRAFISRAEHDSGVDFGPAKEVTFGTKEVLCLDMYRNYFKSELIE